MPAAHTQTAIRACMRLFIASLLAATALQAQAEKISVVYSREIPEADSRLEYPVRLLELALQKSGTEYDIRSHTRPLPQGAALQRLAAGNTINVVWSMTSKEREDELLPIRIPIDKGLFGYRVAFVRQSHKTLMADVKTLDDLRQFSAGQGHDWPDTQILQGNGIKVVTSPAYEGLFTMLHAGRFDYFPRSVLEIWDEAPKAATQDIAVDESVLLYYPTAIYFFVNKKDRALADLIELGLNKAITDGSFDILFYERFGSVIKRANFKGRVPITLHNPLLPAATPLTRKALWLDVNASPK
jgi:hypothetical protein